MNARATGVMLLAAIAISGCDAGGNAPSMTWDDDGVKVTALDGSAVFVTFQGREELEIIGSTNELSVRIVVSSDPPLTPQTFICSAPAQSPGRASVLYTDIDGTSPDPFYQSCSVTLTQVGTFGGAPAIGTFWASLGTPGSTRELTNGTFAVPHEGP
jgi:hypothetical protein